MEMRWERHVACVGGEECLYDFGGRSTHRCKDDIKMGFREVGWGVMD
jgi:hypothetical protein